MTPTAREVYALRLAEESFRHSWDMSDERLIDGAWVAGLCCECGDFVPYGQEVAHVAAAFAPLIGGALAGCCDLCEGTGAGPCWQCRSTGHPHAPDPTCITSPVEGEVQP
jgi:hypothetical protein